MRVLLKPMLLLAGIATCAVAATPARAQFFQYNPGYGNYGQGYYNPYGGNYYGAAGGYLIGASSVIDASGQLQISTGQARLLQQQEKQEKIKTKRQAFDEWRYEQSLTPTLEDNRRAQAQQEVSRSRFDPPVTEIWSGKALNDLLGDLQRLQSASSYGPLTMLDHDLLKRINVTNSTTAAGNSTLVRTGKTQWPLPLMDSSFKADRAAIDKLLPASVEGAKAGEVDAETLSGLIAAVKNLSRDLSAQVADMPSTDYIRAKRYVTELQGATRVLQDPDVANYYSKWTARGSDVAALVQNMTANGLKFAPATTGDHAAYTSLHRAMANYDMAVSQQVRGPEMTASTQGRLVIPASPPPLP